MTTLRAARSPAIIDLNKQPIRCRTVIRGDAKHRTRNLEIPGSRQGAPRNDGVGHTPPRSRGAMRPSLAKFSAQRGRGECRVPSAPAASCAKVVDGMHTSIHSEFTGKRPASPTQRFTAYTALSSVTGLSCHRRRVDTSTRLERQRRGVGTTWFCRPHWRCSSRAPPRPSHPAPRS